MAQHINVRIVDDPDALGEELDHLVETSVKAIAENVINALKGVSGSARLDSGLVLEPIQQTGPHEFTAKIIVDDEVAYRIFIAKTQGTGIYAGHTSYTITPKNRRALHFEQDGLEVFAAKATILGIQPDASYAAEVEDIVNAADDDLRTLIIDGIRNIRGLSRS